MATTETIYHVAADGWDGSSDLLCLARRVEWGDEAEEAIVGKWGSVDPWVYYESEGRQVHCHATLQEAIDYRDEYCPEGIILAIDPADLDVREGREYPHPVVRDEIPAWAIRGPVE